MTPTRKAMEWLPGGQYLLEHGREFHSEALTSSEIEEVRSLMKRAGRTWREEGQCYRNCQLIRIWAHVPEIEYVDGFIREGGIYINHAWLSYKGKVVDPTVRAPRVARRWLPFMHAGEFAPTFSYFGVAHSREVIHEVMRSTRQHQSVSAFFGKAPSDGWFYLENGTRRYVPQ